MNILIIDKKESTIKELKKFLKEFNIVTIKIAKTICASLKILKKYRIDVVIMDIFLKKSFDGIKLAQHIKSKYPFIQIIFLSSIRNNFAISKAIAINPISYLTKPFNKSELYAAILLTKKKIGHIIQLDKEFCYDKKSHLLYKNKHLVTLSYKEKLLLELFINNINRPLSNYTIENEIWPSKAIQANTLRTLIKRLRVKLNHKFITTLNSQGYIFSISST